jgi:hypothetical protein
VNDPGSQRQVLRQLLAEGFMAETGQTWLYDKGQWAVDLLMEHMAEVIAAAVEAHVVEAEYDGAMSPHPVAYRLVPRA